MNFLTSIPKYEFPNINSESCIAIKSIPNCEFPSIKFVHLMVYKIIIESDCQMTCFVLMLHGANGTTLFVLKSTRIVPKMQQSHRRTFLSFPIKVAASAVQSQSTSH